MLGFVPDDASTAPPPLGRTGFERSQLLYSRVQRLARSQHGVILTIRR
jgi:hypothetical protein